MEKDVYSADSISRKIWMTPKLEVLDIEQTYADDNYWEFKEFGGFWKRNQVTLGDS